MSQEITEFNDKRFLNNTATVKYRGRLMSRIECIGYKRGLCGQSVGCTALTEVSLMGTAEQIEGFREHTHICDVALVATGLLPETVSAA